jgi:hypothetical protein
MGADTWPLVLLGLRVGAVVLLYLFLVTAFRALRSDLRGAIVPELALRPTATTPEEAWSSSAATEDDGWDDDWDEEAPDGVASAPARPTRIAPVGGVRLQLWLPIAAAVLVAGFGGTALLLRGDDPGAPPGSSAVETEATTVDPLEPPTVAPAAGRVTVGLATLEDAQLRVTVDGVVEFDGTLRRGQRQAWDAGERIQVWTDNGQQVQLAVNGVDLGAYSPAMGHPDWNRIDFGFWPGWAQ